MYTRLLPALIHSLLILLLFVDISLINASPTPILHHLPLPPRRSLFSPRAVPAPHPPQVPAPTTTPTTLPPSQQQHNNRHEGYIKPLADLAAGYNLKFKEYSKWIKEGSKSIWDKHATAAASTIKGTTSSDDDKKKKDMGNYVSPYLTQFTDKHDSWRSVGLVVMWKHVWWEVVPEWFKGPEPQREDMFLLRAMEDPLYMSVDELPDVFKTRIEELNSKDDASVDGKVSSTY